MIYVVQSGSYGGLDNEVEFLIAAEPGLEDKISEAWKEYWEKLNALRKTYPQCPAAYPKYPVHPSHGMRFVADPDRPGVEVKPSEGFLMSCMATVWLKREDCTPEEDARYAAEVEAWKVAKETYDREVAEFNEKVVDPWRQTVYKPGLELLGEADEYVAKKVGGRVIEEGSGWRVVE